MKFEFATATRIIFGNGTLTQIGPIAATLGQRALLVIGTNAERAAPLREQLAQHNVIISLTLAIPHEPTTTLAIDGAAQARQADCQLVIGFGGGSVIDAGKAIAALMTNPGDPLDYLEVVGRGQPLRHAPAPYIAIPTTAGTGAEVTRNAVLSSLEHRVKASLRHALMLPQVALIDPELTYSLPPAVTASTGLDALTQVMEPYLCAQTNPLTDALCRDGIQRAARSLRRAYEDGTDKTAREDMALASLFGGLALANAKLGAVHGFAGPLGGMYPTAPHGVICAKLLPLVMAANVRALQSRQPNSPALTRYDEVAQLLTGHPTATAADGVAWVQALGQALAIPPLATFGLTPTDFPVIVANSQKASSMQGNPIKLTDEELTTILRLAMV